MGNIKLNLDTGALTELLKEFSLEVEKDLNEGLKTLTTMTHAHVLELAEQELKSTKTMFKQNVTWAEIAPGVFAVTILSPAVWIDDGIKEDTDMKPALLKNAKVSKSGVRYKIIPFDQAKGPSNLTAPAKNDLQELKSALKKKGVPYKKLELNEDGSPKLGKLHSFDLGGRVPGKGNTPILDRVNVYQTKNEKTGKVSRQITTFRTVTDGPGSEGKWIHPGLAPKDFLRRAGEWAETIWTTQIIPEIQRKYNF